MDKLILNTKYEKNTVDEYSKYYDAMNTFRDDEINEKYIIRILDALCQQIQKYSPEYDSNDSYMFKLCIPKFKDMSENMMTNAVENKLCEIMKKISELEWTAIRSDMINMIYECLPDKYSKNLSGKQLEDFLKIFDNINLTISKYENIDKHELIRRLQKTFIFNALSNDIDSSTVEQNKELYQNLIKNIYFRSWNEVEEETEIFSDLLYQAISNYENIYLDTPEEFLKILTDITGKLINEDVRTKSGQQLIQRFYSSGESMLKQSKNHMELLMDKWAKSMFALYKLDRIWMNSIIGNMANQIYYVDDKNRTSAFKNCEYLANDAMGFLNKLIDKFPINEDDDSKSLSDQLSDWNYCIKSMTQTFLQYTLKTPENLEMFISCLLKLMSIPDIDNSCDLFVGSFEKIEKPIQELFKTLTTETFGKTLLKI